METATESQSPMELWNSPIPGPAGYRWGIRGQGQILGGPVVAEAQHLGLYWD